MWFCTKTRNRASAGKFAAASIIAASFGAVGSASAQPLVSVFIQGNTNGGSNYTSSLAVLPGQTVFYEVLEQIAAPGSSNSNGYNGPPAIVLGTQTSADGVNSMSLNLTDTAGATLAQPALASSWQSGTGFTAGTASGNTVSGVFGIQSPGTFVGGTSPSVILTGSFTAGSAKSDTLAASFDYTINDFAGFEVTETGSPSQLLLSASDQTENLASATANDDLPFDPEIGFTPLTLTASSTPEPASGALAGLAAIGLLLRRRRKA